VAFVAAVAAGVPSFAGAQPWIPIGPPGGDARALASDPRDPDILYLGTQHGTLYRSDDAGLHWSRTVPGLAKRGQSLDDVLVDRRGHVLVGFWDLGGSGGGVARSEDGGRTFSIGTEGLEGGGVRALALAPSDHDILVAGTESGVFRSSDGGRVWRRISPEGHAGLRNLDSVAVDPLDANVVYAGTWHLAWKTEDAGRTWKPIQLGMISDSDVMTLTVDRRDPQRVYATACSGIYRSSDGAARWSKVRGIPSTSRRTRAFTQDLAAPTTLLAGTTEGLWVSEDDMASWRLATRRDLVVNAVVTLPGGVVVLGCDGVGILRSTDAGRTFSESNDGFFQRFVSHLTFGPSGDGLFAGVVGDRTHGGVLFASSPGAPWRQTGPGMEGREVLTLTALTKRAPNAPLVLLAGTDGGLFRWTSERREWGRIATVVGGLDERPRVTAVACPTPGVVLAATPIGLLRGADDGATWSHLSLGLGGAVTALAASARTPGLAIAASQLGVFESRDSGASWEQVAAGIERTTLRHLLFHHEDDRTLFALSAQGLLKSTDGGHTWAWRGGGLPQSDITGIALAGDGRTLYASDFFHGGIYTSSDLGATWQRLTTEGLSPDRVWALAIDPARPGRLIAATPGGGLHSYTPPTGASGSQ
jgi:photosystem II stability/assembly factor-like uncharacterized protein